MVINILVSILWALIAASLVIEYAPMCSELSNKDKFTVILIFMIGAPAFALVNLLTAVLDTILPGGWDE